MKQYTKDRCGKVRIPSKSGGVFKEKGIRKREGGDKHV
jgi:hypothetical protein